MLLVSNPCMKHELDPLQSFCKICGHKIVHWKCNQCFSSGMENWDNDELFKTAHTSFLCIHKWEGLTRVATIQRGCHDVVVLSNKNLQVKPLKDAVIEIPDCCIHGAGNLGILTSCNIIFANFNRFTCTHYRSPSSTGVCRTNRCLVDSSLRHCQLY